AALPAGSYHAAEAAAAARGIVGVVEIENTDNIAEWSARTADGVDSLRVEIAVWPDRLEEVIASGWRTGAPVDWQQLVTFGRLKAVVDGSPDTRTARCWGPYPGMDPSHALSCGMESMSVAELRRLLELARDTGIEAAVHAIGDRANSE